MKERKENRRKWGDESVVSSRVISNFAVSFLWLDRGGHYRSDFYL